MPIYVTEGLTKQASQRLDAIQQMEELTVVFIRIDLEPGHRRGAGREPANMMFGFQLYNEMQ
jgi:transcription-repair coupling factor (superfamily II helicase)